MDWVPAHFPKERMGWPIRRTALRTHGPTQGRASRLGHADFQLRPQRSAQFSDRECAFLAGPISHRRPARGCGGLDALPRLFAQGRANGFRTFLAAVKILRRCIFCALTKFATSVPRHDDSGGGTSLARRSRPTYLGGFGFGQMEHGLDARLPPLHAARSDLPTVSSGTTSPSRCSTLFRSISSSC